MDVGQRQGYLQPQSKRWLFVSSRANSLLLFCRLGRHWPKSIILCRKDLLRALALLLDWCAHACAHLVHLEKDQEQFLEKG